MSTNAQAEDDKSSLPLQEEKLRQFAAEKGWLVVGCMRIAHSGADEDAPFLKEITAGFKANKYDAVVFASVDRFARDVLLGLHNVYTWTDMGKEVYIDRERVDVKNPNKMFSLILLLAVAQLKRGSNVAAALRKAFYVETEGAWYRPVPPGFRQKGRGLEVSPEMANVIAIFGAAATRDLADILAMPECQALGLDEPRLVAMIQNPVYIGQIRYGKATFAWDAYAQPAIVAVWNEVARRYPVRTRNSHASEQAMETLAEDVSMLDVIIAAFARGEVGCPECGCPVFFNGTKDVDGHVVPQLDCWNGHGGLLMRSLDFQGFAQKCCFICGNKRRDRWEMQRKDALWTATCAVCRKFSWSATSYPFGETTPSHETAVPASSNHAAPIGGPSQGALLQPSLFSFSARNAK